MAPRRIPSRGWIATRNDRVSAETFLEGTRATDFQNTRHIDAHHIQHWANGGETKPSKLVSLCGFHRRKVHEGGLEVQMLDDGAIPSPWGEGRAKRAGEGSAVIRFIKPNGTVIDISVRRPPVTGYSYRFSTRTKGYITMLELRLRVGRASGVTMALVSKR